MEHGGVMLPRYPAEAMWISFGAEWDALNESARPGWARKGKTFIDGHRLMGDPDPGAPGLPRPAFLSVIVLLRPRTTDGRRFRVQDPRLFYILPAP